MERKSYDEEILWDADEDEARNRRRDPLRDALGAVVTGEDSAAEPPKRGRPSKALVRDELID